MIRTALFLFATLAMFAATARADDKQWVVYEGGEGAGKGKHIVLISGDDEYRSEEALPALGKILSKHHGFKCTVLFPIDPKTGEIKPDFQSNIPGLEALKTADLAIFALRFRNLPDDQMKHIDDYMKTGKPVIGMRTATHSFNGLKGEYAKYNWGANKATGWEKGWGKQILGETWVAHHGGHKSEATRGLIAPDAKDHPILKGIKDGDIWGDTDVYTVNLPLPGDSKPLVLGQVLKGMKFDSVPVEGKKNDPMMPVAWTKTYTIDGKTGRVFTTTMGSATDLVPAGTRRMLVNATYWAMGLEEQIKADACVDLVGEFKPTMYGFGTYKKGMKPGEYEMK